MKNLAEKGGTWLWVDKRPVGHGAVACVGCEAEAGTAAPHLGGA